MDTQPTAHGHYGDVLTKRSHQLTFCLAFIGLYLLFPLGGSFAPDAVRLMPDPPHSVTAPCPNVNCTAEWSFITPHLQPYNQFVYVLMTVHKPDLEGQNLDSFAVDFPLTLRVNLTGVDAKGTTHILQLNREHARDISCPANSNTCNGMVLVTMSHVAYRQLRIGVAVPHPTEAFNSRGLSSSIAADFQVITMNEEYTLLEVGFKYAFMSIAAVVWVAFLVWLSDVPKVAQTPLQHAVAWMLGSLILFNEPLLVLALTNPSPTWSIVASFGKVLGFTCIAAFWLVQVDLVRVMGDARVRTVAAAKLTLWFWLPKVVLLTLLGMTLLALEWFLVWEAATDPAFDIWSEGQFGSALAGFAVFLGVVYLLWLLVLTVLAVRVAWTAPPAILISFALSFVAAVTAMATLFAGSFFGLMSGALFLAASAGVNLYVLAVTALFWPHTAAPSFDGMVRAEQREVGYAVKFTDREVAEGLAGEEQVEVQMGPLEGAAADATPEFGAFAIGEEEVEEEGLDIGVLEEAAGPSSPDSPALDGVLGEVAGTTP